MILFAPLCIIYTPLKRAISFPLMALYVVINSIQSPFAKSPNKYNRRFLRMQAFDIPSVIFNGSE